MTSIDLSTKIANVHLESCIYNASGPKCSTEQELDALANSAASAIITKSATMAHREGNETPRYQNLDLGSINSMGLPNLGIDYYLDYIEHYSFDKPIFLSIAGFSLEENINILKKTEASDKAFAIELNLSCPNIAGKPQTAYDFERTKEVLDKIFSFYQRPLGVKLPPYFDMIHFEEMADILNQYPLSFVTCINSIGNALFIDTAEEAVVIKSKSGFGGLGGEYIKPTALANVRMFYTLLNKEIDVIGCGGISSGKDVFEHILCGASAVQAGTQLMKEGVAVFERLENELKSIMKEKGYSTIADFKGKLKSL